MKNNKNLIIRNNWKTLLLLALMACAGCKRVEHQNVIQDIVKNGKDYTFWITDVETGVQRIYKYTGDRQWGRSTKTYDQDLKYLYVGDVVCLYNLGSDERYQNMLVLSNNEMRIKCNQDSVSARQQRERFNRARVEFDSLKTKAK